MNDLGDHLMIVPIVMPLLAGASMLVLGGERSRNYQAAINLASTFGLIVVALILLLDADTARGGVMGVYRLGD